MQVLLPSVYWPNLQYMAYALRADTLIIEQHEHFVKQSLRSRCEILSANGALRLSIPIVYSHSKTPMKDVEISYRSKWQSEHWRAICSAYNNSPYFDYFTDELRPFYQTKESSLFQFNLKQLQLLLRLLRIKKDIVLSETYIRDCGDVRDLRALGDKTGGKTKEAVSEILLQNTYYQTFSGKFAFVPNLSCLDLLFNTGKSAQDYLKPAIKAIT